MSTEATDLRYIPTAADLFAAATIIEKRCSEQNIAFMECKTKCEHPKECLAQAHDVQECVLDTLKVVKEKCPMEFSAFSGCLDRYNTRYEDCRKTQKKFMACWTKEPVTEEKEE
ncbi:NADH dehydrogenase [Blastocystis sp. subtype 4]|uniref:NADH dehydrogenase n=1 Tax=Blastocystis sp. subtype 4 TaxID=944170 RepID=UPI000711BC66|nr:NADH dehydrogenase [Blastocystis sp. subtype 4]KNB41589.1 NADH dehydrogenase [Blastocystis sp. subtype 4]|eukprot:XP_014525032.1 NADH dehydrogenase [Blastocystis sp. subtype 4]